MTGMHMISCIRFSLQLLITESIYTFGLKRKKYFFWRILLGIVLYFGLALTTFYLLAGIPSENPFISIIYYSCMFVYSLITMNLCFDEKREELLFSAEREGRDDRRDVHRISQDQIRQKEWLFSVSGRRSSDGWLGKV